MDLYSDILAIFWTQSISYSLLLFLFLIVILISIVILIVFLLLISFPTAFAFHSIRDRLLMQPVW